jgi:hypothetical protein
LAGEEDALMAHNTGKWRRTDIPLKGWTCVGVRTYSGPTIRCEMCEKERLTHIHRMRHPEYGGTLWCGRDCASDMGGDLVAQRERQLARKSQAKTLEEQVDAARWRRLTLGSEVGASMDRIAQDDDLWRVNENGNYVFKFEGHRATVFPSKGGWKTILSDRLGEGTPLAWQRREDAAKAAVRDEVLSRYSAEVGPRLETLREELAAVVARKQKWDDELSRAEEEFVAEALAREAQRGGD